MVTSFCGFGKLTLNSTEPNRKFSVSISFVWALFRFCATNNSINIRLPSRHVKLIKGLIYFKGKSDINICTMLCKTGFNAFK